ncbi:hypothetical protein VJ923_06130 [Adlercreutzia sp. R25]|uniref:Nucleotide pyrophosphohydrolase n=1 Tax=Adlercreutzia shanghongiae TaxID=3111773 RepID=A0ABU6IWZ9_9ACTN|nr:MULTISPECIES: hypothetical protein [unclassified Adlercreutzia]MEC4272730.1 hypothetical protein [Adlercreutzia sp. R25]MEC4294371.1 hypothetical protein [Adlercreutzia sp. R22]
MTGFYRFPAMAKLGELTGEQQAEHIAQEAEEVSEALGGMKRCHEMAFTSNEDIDHDKAKESRLAYGMELMDVIHAAETALRMEFEDEELDDLREAVIEKNRARGYYGGDAR